MARQSRPPLLILTRPQAQADRFAAALPADLGVEIVIAPLLDIVLHPVGSLQDVDALILTSENGVRALDGQVPPGLTAYCVGPRTRQAAQALGLAAQDMGGTADALVHALTDLSPPGRLLHLHGAHTRGDIAHRLTAQGLTCDSRCVYDQQARPLPDAVRTRLRTGHPAVVPLFSPRTAALFVQDCPHAPGAVLIAFSPAVADAIPPHGYAGVDMAAAPTGPAMAEAVYRRSAAMRLEGG